LENIKEQMKPLSGNERYELRMPFTIDDSGASSEGVYIIDSNGLKICWVFRACKDDKKAELIVEMLNKKHLLISA